MFEWLKERLRNNGNVADQNVSVLIAAKLCDGLLQLKKQKPTTFTSSSAAASEYDDVAIHSNFDGSKNHGLKRNIKVNGHTLSPTDLLEELQQLNGRNENTNYNTSSSNTTINNNMTATTTTTTSKQHNNDLKHVIDFNTSASYPLTLDLLVTFFRLFSNRNAWKQCLLLLNYVEDMIATNYSLSVHVDLIRHFQPYRASADASSASGVDTVAASNLKNDNNNASMNTNQRSKQQVIANIVNSVLMQNDDRSDELVHIFINNPFQYLSNNTNTNTGSSSSMNNITSYDNNTSTKTSSTNNTITAAEQSFIEQYNKVLLSLCYHYTLAALCRSQQFDSAILLRKRMEQHQVVLEVVGLNHFIRCFNDAHVSTSTNIMSNASGEVEKETPRTNSIADHASNDLLEVDIVKRRRLLLALKPTVLQYIEITCKHTNGTSTRAMKG